MAAGGFWFSQETKPGTRSARIGADAAAPYQSWDVKRGAVGFSVEVINEAARRKGGGSGVWIGIGLAFAMVFDPKAAQATELIERKQDEREDEESGDRP